MIQVNVKNQSTEEFNKAVELFKKKCNKDGFLREIKDRHYFKKPSQKKHEAKAHVKRMIAKQNRKRKKLY